MGFMLAVGVPAAAWAQGGVPAAIAGVVRDSSGGVMPGVTVEAASPALIERIRTAVTDEQGQYKITDLRPGTYSVTFSLAGFSSVKREGLELTAAFTATVNADLKVGSLEETLTVSGQSPVVDVQNTVQQSAITAAVIDAIPTGRTFQSLSQLIPGVSRSDGQDVGGTSGERFSTLAIHGSHSADMPLIYDGMRYNNMNGSGGGGLTVWMINTGNVQEMSVETAGASAENQVSGVFVNVIPKDGGNNFKGMFFANYTTKALQSNNLTDTIKARGLSTVTTSDRIWDVNPAVGGPILQDKLWYFSSIRYWGNATNVGGIWVNKTLNTPFYTPDYSQPGKDGDTYNASENIRLSWQATQKQKFSFYYDIQQRHVQRRNLAPNVAPEATENLYTPRNYFTQVSWTYPITNRLLLQAGNTAYISSFTADRQPEVLDTTIAMREQSTGLQYGALSGRPFFEDVSWAYNQKLALSYTTGSHALSFGLQMIEGRHVRHNDVNQNLWANLLNGVPRSLTVWATPYDTEERLNPSPSLYAQDQWTRKNLTLNVGLRFDYLNAYVPELHFPPVAFVSTPRDFEAVHDVPNWGDVSPRFGASYNLFGNGKTALKASLNRYVASQTAGLANLNDPVITSVTSASRTWTDGNGDYVPNCDFLNLGINGECGAISDTNFGKNNPRATRYDQDTLTGYGKRPYDWEVTGGIQQELTPGVALNASYFRHWFGNFYVTQNTAVTADDFDSYCVTAPVDARLPGGGGNQICGFYDVKPQKFGQVNSLVTFADNFGTQKEVFTGVDVNINARLAGGAFVQGGLTTGRTAMDSCFAADLPQLAYAGSASGVTASRTEPYCDVRPPLSASTQIKFAGSYVLPWNLAVSGTYQNVPGPQINATLTVTNAQIASSLGRNLSSGANGTVTVDLIPPGTLYEERINQLDFRLSRPFQLTAGLRVNTMFDFYNALNSSAVTALNNTFGPAWQRPNSIMPGRLIKFGTQVTW
jgi:hypothetical protein